MTGRVLDISNFPNLLEDIRLTSDQIREQVASMRYETIEEIDEKVEKISIPKFVPSFYDFIVSYGRLPNQDEAFGYALRNDRYEYMQNQTFAKEHLSGIKARHARTYPSLIRDVHFNKYVAENLGREYTVLYNTNLDILEGIDLLLIKEDLLYGICMYTDTPRGRKARLDKEKRHVWCDNVVKIDLPLPMPDNCSRGDIFLYSRNEFDRLTELIRDVERIFEQDRYLLLCDEPDECDKYSKYLPICSVKAACGPFIDGGIPEINTWVNAGICGVKANRDRIIVRALGNSMLPKIKDGDYCVFEKYHGGSREGMIVLARTDEFDSDYSGRYTIKKYHSESVRGDGEYLERKIDLIPLNKDFETLHLSDDEQYATPLVFVGVIDLHQYHCIRCGKRIGLQPGKLNQEFYCTDCRHQWYAEGHNYTTSENYCHVCGQMKENITSARPLCMDCYVKRNTNQ